MAHEDARRVCRELRELAGWLVYRLYRATNRSFTTGHSTRAVAGSRSYVVAVSLKARPRGPPDPVVPGQDVRPALLQVVPQEWLVKRELERCCTAQRNKAK